MQRWTQTRSQVHTSDVRVEPTDSAAASGSDFCQLNGPLIEEIGLIRYRLIRLLG